MTAALVAIVTTFDRGCPRKTRPARVGGGGITDAGHAFLASGQPRKDQPATVLLPCWCETAAGSTLALMNSASAGNRRHLPSSPFKPPPEAPPVERFELNDLVTHDKYGLGHVVLVEGDTAVVVNFTPMRVRIMAPFARMTRLLAERLSAQAGRAGSDESSWSS